MKAPLFVVRQWMRHRAGVFLEKSARYTKIKNPEYYLPPEFQNKKEIKNITKRYFIVKQNKDFLILLALMIHQLFILL